MTPERELPDSSHPGSFTLNYSDGYAVLTVHPPTGSGRPVYADDILNRMKILKIPEVRLRDIEEVIEQSAGTPVKLVQWPAGERLSAKVDITLSDDRMIAFARMHPPHKGGGDLTEQDVIEALDEQGVIYGIDRDEIRVLVGSTEYEIDHPVAHGTPVQHGKGARVTYTFNTEVGKPYLLMDFDRINYKELNFIQNKEKGDILAVLQPSEEPKDGTDVFGENIPADQAAASVVVRPGKNAAFDDIGAKIVALAKGNAVLDGEVIHVEPVVNVKNVNYETGNIDFDGSVVISGTVADGFRVTATGTIEVGECAGKSEMRAGGNVVLKAGINGNKEGTIFCEGDLYAKYIESATVSCNGNLFVEEAIMHSSCSIVGNLVMSGKRAEILGGTTVVGGSIWCKKLGGLYGNLTRASVGIEPDRLKEYADQLHRLGKKREDLNTVDVKIKQIEQHGGGNRDPEEIADMYRQLKSVAEQLSADIASLTQQVHDERIELTPAIDAYCVVQDRLFSGVTISFGLDEYHSPEKGTRKTVLRCIERKIIETGFNPADPPPLKFEEEKP
jgi:uncharacterized protein